MTAEGKPTDAASPDAADDDGDDMGQLVSDLATAVRKRHAAGQGSAGAGTVAPAVETAVEDAHHATLVDASDADGPSIEEEITVDDEPKPPEIEEPAPVVRLVRRMIRAVGTGSMPPPAPAAPEPVPPPAEPPPAEPPPAEPPPPAEAHSDSGPDLDVGPSTETTEETTVELSVDDDGPAQTTPSTAITSPSGTARPAATGGETPPPATAGETPPAHETPAASPGGAPSEADQDAPETSTEQEPTTADEIELLASKGTVDAADDDDVDFESSESSESVDDAEESDVEIEDAPEDKPEPARPPPPPPRKPPPTPASARENKKKPWWERVFNEEYFRTMPVVAQEVTDAECEFLERSLGVERGAAVLDVACGVGRHAVELARRGYQVAGLDLSLSMITRANELAVERGAKVDWLHSDMRDLDLSQAFDAVYCLGTSFGYFDDESNVDVLRRFHRAIKPGGSLILHMTNRDYAVPHHPSMTWFQTDAGVCMEETNFNMFSSRLTVKKTLLFENGRQYEAEVNLRLYSLHEVGNALKQTGFRVVEVSCHHALPGVFFGHCSPEMYLLAQKPVEGD